MTTLTLQYPFETGYVRFIVSAGVAGTTIKRVASDGGQLVAINGYPSDTWHQPGGAGYGEDYRPPIGETVTYVMAPFSATANDPSYPRASIATTPDEAWLRDPIQPTLSRRVIVVTTNTESLQVREHVYAVSGRKLPLVVYDVREGRRGTVRLLVLSATDRYQLEYLLSSGRPLLLTLCASKMWAPCMMAVGNASFTRWGHRDKWTLDLDYIEVADPNETIQRIASPTWQNILDGIPLKAGEPATESLFGQAANPTGNTTGTFELGLKFHVNSPGFVNSFMWYKPVGDTATTHKFNLWNSAGVRLATATTTGETGSGWRAIPLTTPVRAPVGDYTVSWGCNNTKFQYFTATPTDVSPALSFVQNVLTSTLDTCPAGNGGNITYCIDVVFDPYDTWANVKAKYANWLGVATAVRL